MGKPKEALAEYLVKQFLLLEAQQRKISNNSREILLDHHMALR